MMRLRPTPHLRPKCPTFTPKRTIYASYPDHPLHITPAHPAHGLADLRLVNEWDPVAQASVPHDVWVEHMRAIEGADAAAGAANAASGGNAQREGQAPGRERQEQEREEGKRGFTRTPTA